MSSPSLPVLQPPGTPFRRDWYAARPREESLAVEYLEFGQPVLLWGPRHQGQTWFWTRVAEQWRAADPARRILAVDFRSFGPAALTSLDACLHALATAMLESVLDGEAPSDIDARIDRVWQLRGDPPRKLNELLARTVLRAAPGTLLLVLDRADLVVGTPFYDDFASLLRAWVEKSKHQAPWDRLRLVVSVSRNLARASHETHRSAFDNLTPPIRLADLDRDQVASLAALHRLAVSDAELGRLLAVAGGQPHLVRAVLYDLAHARYTIEDLARGAPLGPSLAADHLREHRQRLDGQPELAAAFADLARDPAVSVDATALDALLRQGLVRQGERGTHPVRYPLYERLLRRDTEPLLVHRKQNVFYAFAEEDEGLRERLDVHLAVLKREGLIEPWHHGLLVPGVEWSAESRRRLDAADIVLLLVTADFLASSRGWEVEMSRALERHQAGEARVVPVIVRPCDWKSTPLAKLQAVPKDAIPVTRWADPEDAWVDVAQRIRKLVTGDADTSGEPAVRA